MLVYALVFTACLGAGQDRCREVELPWDGPLQTCILFGQQLAAQWVSQHPGWHPRGRYRCEAGRAA